MYVWYRTDRDDWKIVCLKKNLQKFNIPPSPYPPYPSLMMKHLFPPSLASLPLPLLLVLYTDILGLILQKNDKSPLPKSTIVSESGINSIIYISIIPAFKIKRNPQFQMMTKWNRNQEDFPNLSIYQLCTWKMSVSHLMRAIS